jgi:hypothetical protein
LRYTDCGAVNNDLSACAFFFRENIDAVFADTDLLRR